MVRNIYSDLRAVTSKDWCSAPIPLLIGVYQGDPLFPVVFDTVMSTLTDSLRSHNSCGYTMSGSSLSTNVLLYADDVCLLADGPAGAQLLLSQVERWLKWSGMRAKIAKCSALVIAASSARRFDPALSLNGQAIPFAGSGPVRFLGGPISIPTNSRGKQRRVQEKLELLLTRVDKCLVTRKQKLLLYKAGVCPRMNWELVTGDFPISWVSSTLEATVTTFLKRWSGLARLADTARLYLPRQEGVWVCRQSSCSIRGLGSLSVLCC